MYGTDGMGNTAENLVEKYNISREDQDKFAYWSQMKASKAQSNGRLAKEIVTVEIPQRKKDPIHFQKMNLSNQIQHWRYWENYEVHSKRTEV